MWAQRTTEWQYPALVQLIMVKYRETSCSPPRPAKNHLTMPLFSTFVRIDRYLKKDGSFQISVNVLQFISEKEKCEWVPLGETENYVQE